MEIVKRVGDEAAIGGLREPKDTTKGATELALKAKLANEAPERSALVIELNNQRKGDAERVEWVGDEAAIDGVREPKDTAESATGLVLRAKLAYEAPEQGVRPGH